VPGRFLVTGALGCIGAWTSLTLAREGVPVIALDLSNDRRRLELISEPGELDGITFVQGDITELATVDRILAEYEITNVVHLAALQIPFCQADPVLGARVNVVGTVNVFEAAKKNGLGTPIAYASSAAVYDEHGEISPRTHYAVYKVANESTAHVYWEGDGIASVGLRPFCVYGPGRDQGLTSSPTLAMLAAARGEPYRISFGGRTQLHYVPDVARAFVAAARNEPEGAPVFNLGGEDVHMSEVVEAIEAAAPEAAGLIEFEEAPLPFPERLPEPTFDFELTPLADGVRESIEMFRRA
jgi:UDP-glucuronate 4-epimerase